MAVLVDNPDTIAELERMAAATGKSAPQIIDEAVRAHGRYPSAKLTEHEIEQALESVRMLQEAVAANRDPSDDRSADEIIGYNAQGHFD